MCVSFLRFCQIKSHFDASGNGACSIAVLHPFPPRWEGNLLLSPCTRTSATRCTTRRSDLGCRHQVADILLEEFVVVVQLVVFFLDSFDSVEDLEEGELEGFGVSVSFCISILLQSERDCGLGKHTRSITL